MAAFSLWQLLNQQRASGNMDDSDPDQQKAAGQSIGQSLVDFWDRTNADRTGPGSYAADANPYVSDLVDYWPPPGTPSIPPQLLPYHPTDQTGAELLPFSAGTLAPDLNKPRSEGENWPRSNRDPNVKPALLPLLAYPAAEAALWAAPLIAGAWYAQRQLNARRPTTAPPPPPSPFTPPITIGAPPVVDPHPGEPPSASIPSGAEPSFAPYPRPPIDAGPSLPGAMGAPSDSTTQSATVPPDMPVPAPGSSPMPSAPSADDLIDMIYRRSPEEDAAFPGDFSNGYHGDLERSFIGWLRQNGCLVEPHVRFNKWGDPRYAIADWVAKCAGENLPNLNDAKTGVWAKFTRNQNIVYPAVEAGEGFSDDPKMATFGLPSGRMPAMVVNRIWSKPRGAMAIIDRPFGPME